MKFKSKINVVRGIKLIAELITTRGSFTLDEALEAIAENASAENAAQLQERFLPNWKEKEREIVTSERLLKLMVCNEMIDLWPGGTYKTLNGYVTIAERYYLHPAEKIHHRYQRG